MLIAGLVRSSAWGACFRRKTASSVQPGCFARSAPKMSGALMPIWFAAYWLSVRVGLPATSGAGGRLAVIPHPRFAPTGSAIGLSRDVPPASQRTSPSSRSLLKHPR